MYQLYVLLYVLVVCTSCMHQLFGQAVYQFYVLVVCTSCMYQMYVLFICTGYMQQLCELVICTSCMYQLYVLVVFIRSMYQLYVLIISCMNQLYVLGCSCRHQLNGLLTCNMRIYILVQVEKLNYQIHHLQQDLRRVLDIINQVRPLPLLPAPPSDTRCIWLPF